MQKFKVARDTKSRFTSYNGVATANETKEQTTVRFESRFIKSESGCWDWIGGKTGNGYGGFAVGRKTYGAHRMSLYLYRDNELMSFKKVIDHLCRNRGCVNPNHLEVVSQKENSLRGVGITAINSKKTHCKRGHEFISENIYEIVRRGKYAGKGCRICRNAYARENNKKARSRQSLL